MAGSEQRTRDPLDLDRASSRRIRILAALAPANRRISGGFTVEANLGRPLPSVLLPQRDPKLDRGPFHISSLDIAVTPSGFPRTLGNTSLLPRPSTRASSRISTARRLSGTRCWRFTFVRGAGMVHTPSSRSISVHTALRTSPERVAVSTRNSKASFTTGPEFDDLTFSNRGRHLAVRQRPHMPHDLPPRPEHRTDPVARVVGPEVHRHRPPHDRADALAQLPGRGRLVVPDRSENPDPGPARGTRG